MKKNEVKEILSITTCEYEKLTEYINDCGVKFTKRNFSFLEDDGEPLTSISIYSFYPLLFKKILRIPNDQLNILMKISHFHFISLFLLDKIYDEEIVTEAFELLALLDIYSENKKTMEKYFKKDSTAQSLVENYFLATKKGMFEEKYSYKRDTNMTLAEIEKYCFSKYSYMKIAILLYTEVSEYKEEKKIQELLLTHDYFAVGRQILDDIDDYLEDYENDSFNIYTNYFIIKHGDNSILYEDHNLKMELLDLSIMYLDKAMDLMEGYSDTGWFNYIKFYETEAQRIKKLLVNKKS